MLMADWNLASSDLHMLVSEEVQEHWADRAAGSARSPSPQRTEILLSAVVTVGWRSGEAGWGTLLCGHSGQKASSDECKSLLRKPDLPLLLWVLQMLAQVGFCFSQPRVWRGWHAGDKVCCWVQLAASTRSRISFRRVGWRWAAGRSSAFWDKSAFFNQKRHFATTEEIKHLSLLAMMTLWTTILGQKGIYYPVAVLTLY